LLLGYRREWLRSDVLAGLVLAAVILPVGMAYAELAGLPPVVGLYASLIPLFAYAIFGPSPTLVVGPDSATAALVGAAIIPLALVGTTHRLALAAMLAVLVGGMCVAVGLSRLGFVTSLLSKPVRIGYMNGIAVVVIVSQLPKLFGFKAPAEGPIGEAFAFAAGLVSTNPVAIALGAGSLAIILLAKRFAPSFPSPLAVVVGSAALVAVVGEAKMGIATVGRLPQGLPSLSWPGVGASQTLTLFAAAVGIAIITLTDTTVLSTSFASRLRYDVDANEEFLAMGLANVVSGLFQGFPVSASSTRSAANQTAGAKSPLSGVVAGVALGTMLVAVPWLVSTLPIAVLAAIVITAGLELADVKGTLRLLNVRRTEFALSMVSFIGVLVLGILPGVFFAVGLSVLNFMRRQWWPHDAVLGRVPGVKGYHDIGDFPEAAQIPGLLLYRFDAPLFFANASIFRQRLKDRIDSAETPVRRVVLCAEPLIDVDTTAADSLGELIDELAADGIEFAFAELKHPVRAHLARYGLVDEAGGPNLYPTIGSAVHAFVDVHGVDWVDWEDAEEHAAAVEAAKAEDAEHTDKPNAPG
jgi:high affinity sulfate transporter 1